MAKTKAAQKATPKNKRPRDINQLAHFLVNTTTESGKDNPPKASPEVKQYMAEIGQIGGRIGGVKRASTLTREQRREIARQAARARWDKEN